MKKTVSNKLITKLIASVFLIILGMGLIYIFTTSYFAQKHFDETAQRLNANLATHLIEEKFQNADPFLEDGTVNKPLFGDLMHDMMAVNRRIEVYLLSEVGEVLYSVVLDHSDVGAPLQKVSLTPVKKFIASQGESYILGDDPRTGLENIFSAGHFEKNGQSGYIYIILAGKSYKEINANILSGYFMKLGLGATILTMLFAFIVSFLAIRMLTSSLKEIITKVRRFQEGDLESRVEEAESSDLSGLSLAFNDMATTIVRNIDDMKAIDSFRRELIANISHDLRTPLAILQGYVETLQMKGPSLDEADREKYLLTIHSSADRLSKLVSQLFEYTKLEAKQVIPQKEAFSMTDLALDLCNKYQVLATKKGLKLELKAEKNIPLVFADIGLVERVIQNLLDNALKFSSAGDEVALKLEANNKEVLITIKDTGPGIPENEQAFIFERYRKAPSDKQNTGSGLGLAIVKKIIEIHESAIKVISQPNEGTAFQFTLPAYQGV